MMNQSDGAEDVVMNILKGDGESARASRRVASREQRIRAANILRVCRRRDGTPLNDVQVAHRVGGILPSEVAAVRAELDARGYLAEEIERVEAGEGGDS